MTLIQSVKEKRQALGMTQEALAEKCGLTQSVIGRIESGRSNPTIDTMEKMANALNMTVDIRPLRNTVDIDRIMLYINPIKRDAVYKSIKEAEKNPDIRRMVVFGSAIREDCTEDSDIDICLELADKEDKKKLHESNAAISKACNHNCDILIYSKLKDWFKETVNKGVVVYELS